MSKRKFVKTDYDQIILREDDKIIHLDAESLAELYWEVKDKKLVRVVKCKDCKWWKTIYFWEGHEHTICSRETYELSRKAEDFCSYGERRKDG